MLLFVCCVWRLAFGVLGFVYVCALPTVLVKIAVWVCILFVVVVRRLHLTYYMHHMFVRPEHGVELFRQNQ